jgi:hypothetical protein
MATTRYPNTNDLRRQVGSPRSKGRGTSQGATTRQPWGRLDRTWRLTSRACRKQRYPLSQHPDIRQLPLRRPGMHLQACGSEQGILSARLVSRDLGSVKPICFCNIARAERLQTHYAPCVKTLDKGGYPNHELPGPTVSSRRRRIIPTRTRRATPRVHGVPALVSELSLTSLSAANLAKKAFNVESPSFTPAPQQAASKKSTFSSQAASAAPFTPRGVGGRLPPNAYHSSPYI